MNIFLSVFAPENLVSRGGFGSPVPRQPISILRLNLVFTYGIPPEFRDGSIHLFYRRLPISILRLNLVFTYGIPPDFRDGSIYLFYRRTGSGQSQV